jgi:hypothetical protein
MTTGSIFFIGNVTVLIRDAGFTLLTILPSSTCMSKSRLAMGYTQHG